MQSIFTYICVWRGISNRSSSSQCYFQVFLFNNKHTEKYKEERRWDGLSDVEQEAITTSRTDKWAARQGSTLYLTIATKLSTQEQADSLVWFPVMMVNNRKMISVLDHLRDFVGVSDTFAPLYKAILTCGVPQDAIPGPLSFCFTMQQFHPADNLIEFDLPNKPPGRY